MDDVTKPPVVDYENLEFHPLANIFPLIEGEEFEAFVEAFRRQGLLNQIVLHEGKIFDGRNRYRAGKRTGCKWTDKHFITLAPGKDPLEFVLAANVQRRHLTIEQKRDLIIRQFRERPNLTDRKIALLMGVSNKTVSTYRNQLQEKYDKFVANWGDLDPVQQREFVTAYRHELMQASTV